MGLFESEHYSNPLDTLKKNIIENRIPISATLYLTNKCNFRCLHCYVQSQKNVDNGSLNVSQWKQIIDTLKQRGCISLMFSGGEVLASSKFLEIYSYACLHNFHVELITNLSLLKSFHIKLFLNNRPNSIIVTIYGSSNETYRKFCGVDGAWDIVRKNILLLKSYGINIRLQTVLNTINFHELVDMKKFALENKLPFTVFRNINCEIDGNARPLQYQISLQQEIESFKIMEDSKDFLAMVDNNFRMWERGFKKCFAGISYCYIDCCGNMFLCNHCTDSKFNVIEEGFDFAWKKMYEFRQKEIEVENICSSCPHKNFCGKCSPTFKKLKNAIGFPFPDCEKILQIKDYLKSEV